MSALPLAPLPPAAVPSPLSAPALGACSASQPAPGHAALREALRRATGIEFLLRLSRGGWYRPGRILDAAGAVVAADALAWLEQAWADADEEGPLLAERLVRSGYAVTRFDGITHYLVASAGPRAADFVQLEVEELIERVSHRFAPSAPVPDSVDAMLAPPRSGARQLSAAIASQYRFRRIVEFTPPSATPSAPDAAPAGAGPALQRFLAEWDAGGHARTFCDHWVLALSDHADRHGQMRLAARPVPATAPAWRGLAGERGLALAQRLQDFDRDAGYRSAWYFHMVCGHRVPRDIPPLVAADLDAGMAYLPERDAALLAGWLREPYSI